MVNQGIITRDEQMSERSEAVSYRSDALVRLDEVIDWIDGIPLSRKIYARNLARDFSDAVLMAEILKFYYPNLVSPHNYIPANNIQGKRDNWNVLNRKVLAKIDMRLPPDVIENLVHSQNGVIEKVLLDFRDKQLPAACKVERAKSATDLETNEAVLNSRLRMDLKKQQERERKSAVAKAFRLISQFFISVFRIFVAFLCFWRWFSSSKNKQSSEKNYKELALNEDESQIRDAYLKALDDLERHYEAIKTLRYKVAFLEGTIKLKDAKIASLQNEVDNRHHHRASDVIHSARMSFESAHKPRIPAVRPKTQF